MFTSICNRYLFSRCIEAAPFKSTSNEFESLCLAELRRQLPMMIFGRNLDPDNDQFNYSALSTIKWQGSLAQSASGHLRILRTGHETQSKAHCALLSGAN